MSDDAPTQRVLFLRQHDLSTPTVSPTRDLPALASYCRTVALIAVSTPSTPSHRFSLYPSLSFKMTSCDVGETLETVAFMKLALEQAKIAFDSLEVPVGCVIAMDGKVISSGRNRTNETRNATRHAEMEAIDILLEKWKEKKLTKAEVTDIFSKCSLYVTCEPCIMCAAALSFLGIKHVYYGCANDKFGGCGSILSLHMTSCEDVGGKSYKFTGGIMAAEAVSLFRNFYELGNPNAPKPHRQPVQQL